MVCPAGCTTEANANYDGNACSLLMAAYILAGLAMMLNIRLSYSSAPYALIRFKLPENLFSVFVRRMASALELWCLPSMLLGNIIDLTQKLIDKDPELRAIKAKAAQIQTKASQLKTTAETHSTAELGSTQHTDLEAGGNAQNGLQAKATELKNAASELHTVAQQLESAAQTGSPLKPLLTEARQLKDAAGTSDSVKGLYKAADELSKKTGGVAAQTEAEKVITEFDKVEQKYEELIAKAKENGQTNNEKVVAIVNAYQAVKNTYYQMLIRYRITSQVGDGQSDNKILHKASDLYSKADSLAQAPGLQDAQDTQKQELKGLATELKDVVGANIGVDGLQQALSQLKAATDDAQIVTRALAVMNKYKEVKDAYDKVIARESDYSNLAKTQYDPVKSAFEALEKKFDALRKSYENVLKLRVQELATLADNLKTKADTLSSDRDLTALANALRDAAMSSSSQDGLKEKATALVQAINTNGTVTTQATQVITQFDKVAKAYEALSAKANEINKQSNVKAVDEAYKALKNLYDSILIFTKMKQPATDMDSKATSIPDPATAKEVKTIIDKFKAVYDSIPADQSDIKATVQNPWESIKNVITCHMKCWKFYWIIVPSIVTQWLNFLTYVLLLVVYLMGGDQGHLTTFYFVIAISGVVFGINMTLVYSVDFYYIPVYIAGENSFPIITSFIHYLATLMFGNRRKWNSDFLLVNIDIWVAIIISFVAAVVWTLGYLCELDGAGEYDKMKHIHAHGFGGDPKPEVISPFLMIVVGMGLVYAIYPGIAPGMIVPFYLIDKIEMVLLIATIFPPVIIAILRIKAKAWSPQHNTGQFNLWTYYKYAPNWGGPKDTPVHAYLWHFFDLLIVIKITLAAIFICSLHYRDSNISRSIVNQPKMSTALSITFYMCHEILLAVGFSGFIGNDGGDWILIPQYIGALFMIFLAFYSEGYIIEYKSHDPAHWPTLSGIYMDTTN